MFRKLALAGALAFARLDGKRVKASRRRGAVLAHQQVGVLLVELLDIGEEGGASYRRSSGALLSIFNDRLRSKERFVGVRIDDKQDVYPALKQFFNKRGLEV